MARLLNHQRMPKPVFFLIAVLVAIALQSSPSRTQPASAPPSTPSPQAPATISQPASPTQVTPPASQASLALTDFIQYEKFLIERAASFEKLTQQQLDCHRSRSRRRQCRRGRSSPGHGGMGRRCGYVGGTSGVPQIPDDLSRRAIQQPWANKRHSRM